MKYNKIVISTFFYVFVWRHVVRFLTETFTRITEVDYAHARHMIGELVRIKPTPLELDAWYRKNRIEYQSERIDNIKTAEAFLRDKGGDCDDFAEFAYMVLSNSGYRCRRLFLSGSSPSHVVTLRTLKISIL